MIEQREREKWQVATSLFNLYLVIGCVNMGHLMLQKTRITN